MLPETAAQLVELERLQQALTEAEERAKTTGISICGPLRTWTTSASARSATSRRPTATGSRSSPQELLPVWDSLELAVQNAGKAADLRTLVQGQEATLQLLSKALQKIGVATINPQGEPFDPARHEAMMAQESATAEPNSVLQVVQPGYELNGRVLRPARVIVSKALRRARLSRHFLQVPLLE